MRIQIANDNSSDDLYAEIFHDGHIWAEVTSRRGSRALTITIFPSSTGANLSFSVEELEIALADARAALQAHDKQSGS